MSGLDVSGVLVPAVTPFDDRGGDVDLAGFADNIGKWADAGVHGFVVGGSTGEAVLLDEDERCATWDVARRSCSGRLLVGGTGAESLRATLRLTKKAASLGCDAVLVQPPSFYKGAMTPEVVRDHYCAVADRSPVPVIVYQVPTRFSTLDFPTGLVAELAKHENIAGIKDSRGKLDVAADLVTCAGPGFQVVVGSGSLLYAALEVGAAGGILGVANLAPKECVRIYERFRAGDSQGAGAAQGVVAPLHDGIVGGMGVPGVKRGLDLLGLRGGAPRAPLRPLPAKRLDELSALLAAAGLRPLGAGPEGDAAAG